ncbi:MAG: extracellular solute-binding protein [Acidobacteria bacterium]|nr:extracellular solute-binding protein [Acidobacteriota bacterium]
MGQQKAYQERNLGLKAFSALVYLFLYAPIVILVIFSFNQSKLNVVWQGFTLKWYEIAWRDIAVIQSVRVSLVVALLSTIFSTVLGTLGALALTRYELRLRAFYDTLFYLPVIIPEIVIGFATVIFFGLIGFKLGISSIVIAHVAFSVSYVVFVVRARLVGMDRSLEEASMDLGANELQTFFRVTLPLLMPGIISASLLVFTISLDDYVITSFVAGSNATTLPLQIYSMVKTGVTPEINAISSVLLVVTIVLVYLSHQLQREQPPKSALAIVVLVTILLGSFAVGGVTTNNQTRQLNLYIWSNYASAEMLKKFEERYNVKVRVDLYDSNEALLAKLQTGLVDYDLIVPSDYMVSILIKQNLLQPIDRDSLPNLANLDTRFLALPFDPENRYSIPYTWGTTGIGYRKDKINGNFDSWSVLWDEKYKDRIALLDDVREVFGAALKKQGLSLNVTDSNQIAKTANLLKEQKSLVKVYDSATFAELLLSGDAYLVQGYSGQIGKAMAENPNIAYFIPKEGATIWTDNICIPKGAPNSDLAVLFINFILDPQISGENTNITAYSTPNKAAKEFIKPEILNNPALFPSDESLKNCEFIKDVGSAIQTYDRYWTEIKSE